MLKFLNNPGIIMAWLEGMVPHVISFLLQVLFAIVLFFIGKKLIKWIVKICTRAMERAKVEAGVVTFLGQLIKYILYFILIFMLLGIFGIGTGSAVAVLGSLGVTIGLALQGSLSNFAGGVLILILKPFVIGDYIVDDNGHEGTVSAISIFHTSLTTIDNRVILIPNGVLTNSTLINVSKMDKRRVDLLVGVSYESNLDLVKDTLWSVIKEETEILEDEPVSVFVSELADSSVNMGVRVWVSADSYWDVKWRMTEAIKRKFDENHICIPYPQVEISMKK